MGFLAQSGKMVIDEVQRVPDLVSYVQAAVDESGVAGRFILTGGHRFGLTEAVDVHYLESTYLNSK